MNVQAHRVTSTGSGQLALLLIASYLISILCTHYFLLSDELYYNSLSGELSVNQVANFLVVIKKWEWLGYICLPVLLVVKFSLVATILSTGYYLANSVWNFRPFLRVALVAEFIFIFAAIVKIYWFGWFHTSYTLNELQNFSPLSLSSMVALREPNSWLRYPFQVVSLFELAYCLLLVLGVRQLLQLSWGQAARLVGFSYLPALIVWIILVMFLSISST